eukprot:GGOE01053535.1.p1 GENE.GGOE01053535.1~~GGOE01053535.1.p1  ORF type:complete len:682 (+),score=176.99 GGOE01053535.1:305-2047(+)
MNQLQVQHRYAGEAYERLRQAEMKWHEALHQLEAQQHQTAQMEGILHHAEAEAQMSKAGLLEQLNWHRQQLSRAQDEIRRLRPAEAHFTAVTSEVEYLRSQMAHMRELEERFENVSKEADVLRAQLVKQEHNIDRYTHQTESFYQSANNENISIKKQLAAREDELLHLRERFTDAVDEIHHSHDQVRRAEAELKRVRSEADDLNDFVSEAIYLKHQFGDASNQLSRMEDRVERLTAENEHLHAQLDAAEAEIERLSVALGDESKKTRFLEAALNEEIADNKAVRRQLNEAVVHQTHVATAFKQDAAVLSSDVEVKNMEIERLQNRLADVTRELDKYTSMYEEAVVDVDRLKAALTEEITEHKHIRGVAEEQKQKADLALDELHRLGDPARALRQRLAEAEAEVVHLRHVISDQRVEIESLSQPRVVEYIPPQPPSLTMGYSLGDPVVQPALVSPPKGYKFAYFGVEVAEGAFLSKNYGEPAPIPAVRVVNVGGPCKEAGLKPGDLISSILGRQVGTLDDFNAVVSSVAPHTEVKIIFERDGVLLGTDIVTEETKREPGLPGRTPFESNRKGRPNSKKPGK